MSIFREIDSILESAKAEFEEIKKSIKTKKEIELSEFFFDYDIEKYGIEAGINNTFFWGDNLELMKRLLASSINNNVQLIYIDPPFFSKAKYDAYVGYAGYKVKDTAYTDSFSGGIGEYVKMLAIRLLCIRELLADTGSVWLHLDWHAAHYMKIIMDEIFGEENFINEIIWSYKSGGSGKRSFSKKHDTLLFYSKTKNYYLNIPKEKSYNRGMSPYRFKNVTEYEDEIGWYTLVNMKDVWQIDMLGRTSKERTGYMTQKPESLMRRIIESCSKKGDICIDFFSGSGSFAISCAKLERNWIASDFGNVAGAIMRKRCLENLENFNIVYQSNKKVRNILDISIERFEKDYIIKLVKNPGFIREIEIWGIYEIKENGKYAALENIKRDASGELDDVVKISSDIGDGSCKYAVLAIDIFGNIYEKEFSTEGVYI